MLVLEYVIVMCSSHNIILIVKVYSETAAPVQLSSGGNESALTMLYLQQLNHSLSSLSEKVEEIALNYSQELSALKMVAMNNSQELFALNEQIEQNTLLLYSINKSGVSGLFPAPSCAALPPSSPSGYYWVRNSVGFAVHVYCDMTRSCG